MDGIDLQPHGGDKVFAGLRTATDALEHLISDKHSNLGATQLQPIVDELVRAARIYESTALAEAIAGGGDAKEIAAAKSEQAQADGALAAGKYPEGIDHLGHAWQHALGATQKR